MLWQTNKMPCRIRLVHLFSPCGMLKVLQDYGCGITILSSLYYNTMVVVLQYFRLSITILLRFRGHYSRQFPVFFCMGAHALLHDFATFRRFSVDNFPVWDALKKNFTMVCPCCNALFTGFSLWPTMQGLFLL